MLQFLTTNFLSNSSIILISWIMTLAIMIKGLTTVKNDDFKFALVVLGMLEFIVSAWIIL